LKTSTKTKLYPPSRDFKITLNEFLKNPKEAEGYLEEAFQRSLEDGNGAVFQLALRDVAEARGGIRALAKISGMPPESVYRVLSKDRDPKFASILKISRSLGFGPFNKGTAKAH